MRRLVLCLSAALAGVSAPAQITVPGAEDGVPPVVDSMYNRGLRFLAGSQGPSGAWEDGYGSQPGVVGLAVMAMLAGGEDPNSGPFSGSINRALKFILSQQNAESGYIGNSMYNHGFATTALAEAYGAVDMAGLGAALQKAVDLSLNSQKANRSGAWRYSPESRDADTSVAGSVLVSLFAARNAGLAVPDAAFEKGLEYFDKMRTAGGGYGYTNPSSPNFNRTAIGLLVFSLAKKKDQAHYAESLKYLSTNLNYREQAYPFYFEYYMSQALFHADLETWRKWNQLNVQYLSNTQSADGSWVGGKGPTFNTAGALLSLALNYRFLPIYER